MRKSGRRLRCVVESLRRIRRHALGRSSRALGADPAGRLLLKKGENDEASKAFLEFLKGPEARAVFEKFGYTLEYSHLGLGKLFHTRTTCRCSDNARASAHRPRSRGADQSRKDHALCGPTRPSAPKRTPFSRQDSPFSYRSRRPDNLCTFVSSPPYWEPRSGQTAPATFLL